MAGGIGVRVVWRDLARNGSVSCALAVIVVRRRDSVEGSTQTSYSVMGLESPKSPVP